jgi:hypothetical protein
MSKLKGGKYNNVENISTLEVDDYLCVMHDASFHVNLTIIMYKWPQTRQGTHKNCLWDG